MSISPASSPREVLHPIPLVTPKKPWSARDIRAQLYRRLEIERVGRVLLVKPARENQSLYRVWEEDNARYELFYHLCASLALRQREAFLKELDTLEVYPRFPADVYDRECYRQAWLAAIREIREEVLAMKPMSKSEPKAVPSTKHVQPTTAKQTTAEQAEAPKLEVPESEKAPASVATPPQIASSAPGADDSSVDAILLDIKDEPNWRELAAFLGDDRERDHIVRFGRVYDDFWRGVGYAEPKVPPDVLRKTVRSLVTILDDLLSIWNELETYRIARWRETKASSKLNVSPSAANDVLGGKLRLCLAELDERTQFFRELPSAHGERRANDVQYLEIASLIDKEVGRLKELVAVRLSQSAKAYVKLSKSSR